MNVPTSELDSATGRLDASLPSLCWQLEQAAELLRGRATEETLLEGRWRLDEVDDLLGALARDQAVPVLANRLGRIRDSLGGHLAAAHDCAIAGVRNEVIADVLCRGATMVCADLQALATTVR